MPPKHTGLHISIKAEKIFTLFGFPITNTLLTSFIVFAIFVLITLYYKIQSERRDKSTFFYFLTFVLRAIYTLFESVFGEKIKYFFPLVGSFFFFILLQNWWGLIPGVGSVLVTITENRHELFVPLLRGGTTDLNTTLALAFITVGFSQFIGIKHLGLFGYIKKFINFKSPMLFFTGFMETISEFAKIISFSFRLFGNIFAGEVIIAIMAFLVPIFISFPFLLFEIFIGVVQALVFSMLSAVFYSLAMEKAH